MQLLFLDFDGVLHPVRSSKADHFCRRQKCDSERGLGAETFEELRAKLRFLCEAE